jgi:cell division protein FtsB
MGDVIDRVLQIKRDLLELERELEELSAEQSEVFRRWMKDEEGRNTSH